MSRVTSSGVEALRILRVRPSIAGSTTVATWWVESLLAQRRPRGMPPVVETALVDGDKQMVGEHAEEDVGLHAVLEVMEDRALHQRALQGAEGRLDSREQDIEMPDLFVSEILAIGLEQVGAVQRAGGRLFLCLLGPAHRRRRGVVADDVVPPDPRVALLEPADRLLDLGGVTQTARRHARLEFAEVGQQPLLVRVADRAILVDARLA